MLRLGRDCAVEASEGGCRRAWEGSGVDFAGWSGEVHWRGSMCGLGDSLAFWVRGAPGSRRVGALSILKINYIMMDNYSLPGSVSQERETEVERFSRLTQEGGQRGSAEGGNRAEAILALSRG